MTFSPSLPNAPAPPERAPSRRTALAAGVAGAGAAALVPVGALATLALAHLLPARDGPWATIAAAHRVVPFLWALDVLPVAAGWLAWRAARRHRRGGGGAPAPPAGSAADGDAWLRLSLWGAKVAVWSYDPAADVLAVTVLVAGADATGALPPTRTRREPLAAFLARLHPDDRERVAEAFRAALAGEERYEVEFRLPLDDQRVQRVACSGRLLRDARGQVTLVGVGRDVTRQRAFEQRRRDAEQLETVGRLAAGVAHDFNNLLAVVLANVELAQLAVAESPAARHDEELAQIRDAALRAAALSRQLLALSRRRAARAEPVALGDVVRGVQPLLARVLGTDVHLLVDAPSAGRVFADVGQLEQVVMNLVVNARDAMPRGGTVHVSVAARTLPGLARVGARELPGGAYEVLTVADQGIGMSPDVAARIFDPYFTTKPAHAGTGIGLATVEGIVAQLEGAIEVRTSPGRGSAFAVWLPRHHATAPAPGDAAADDSAGDVPAPALAGAPARAGTVLLVEDEGHLRAALRRILERAGYDVVEARHGVEALRLVAERAHDAPDRRIDVVLSDVVMPEMGGTELVASLRLLSPRTPAVLMTGHADRAALVAEGRTPVLQKPFTPDALLAAMRGAMGR